MIDKDDLLNNKDFYKSFKNADDLTSFFKTMYKRAVEHMLEAELDALQLKSGVTNKNPAHAHIKNELTSEVTP